MKTSAWHGCDPKSSRTISSPPAGGRRLAFYSSRNDLHAGRDGSEGRRSGPSNILAPVFRPAISPSAAATLTTLRARAQRSRGTARRHPMARRPCGAHTTAHPDRSRLLRTHRNESREQRRVDSGPRSHRRSSGRHPRARREAPQESSGRHSHSAPLMTSVSEQVAQRAFWAETTGTKMDLGAVRRRNPVSTSCT